MGGEPVSAARGEHACRILVAEDSRSDVYLLREALRKYSVDHHLYVAPNGAIARDLIDDAKSGALTVDLFVLDLGLPRVRGGDLLRQIRADPRLAQKPVVILTPSSSAVDRAEMLGWGATHFVTKPFDVEAYLDLGAVFRDLCTCREPRG